MGVGDILSILIDMILSYLSHAIVYDILCMIFSGIVNVIYTKVNWNIVRLSDGIFCVIVCVQVYQQGDIQLPWLP